MKSPSLVFYSDTHVSVLQEPLRPTLPAAVYRVQEGGILAHAQRVSIVLLFVFRPYFDGHVSFPAAIGQLYGRTPLKMDHLPILAREVGFVTIGVWKE